VLDQCDAINKGAMETGTRKFGGISELIFQLEKLKNFADFGSEDIVLHANATIEILSRITDVTEINLNGGKNQVTKAIKAAMKPLASAIREMYDMTSPDAGVARRSLE